MDGSAEVATDHGGESEPAGEGGHAEHRSRWPLAAAAGAGALYLGAGLLFVGPALVPAVLGWMFAGVGTLVLLAGLAGWTNEAFLAGHRADRPGVYTGGMVLFLVSDVATFAAGFVYYAFVRTGPWPPENLPPLLGSLVIANTLILVASSVTLHYGHASLEEGNRRRFLGLLGLTVALGVVFVAGQALEYYEFLVEEGFTVSSGVFASAFYGLTGLHGLHVTLGVVLLSIVFARALAGHYGADSDTGVRTVSLYWHFVDAVWILLVAILYVGASVG